MGQTRCGAACANTQVSNLNCGMCGRACSATQTCVFGNCVTLGGACPMGQVRCAGGGIMLPACVDTQTSNTHCGMCGSACPTGTTCMAGACR
jgi:hypothetical protein